MNVSSFQNYEFKRQGVVVAMVDESVAGHMCLEHCDVTKFFHRAKNLFTVDQYLMWSFAACAMAVGCIFFNKSASGYDRAHVTAFSEFALGLNGNGEEARGIKVGLQMDHQGAVWASTVYPVETGVGTLTVHRQTCTYSF